MKSVCMKNVNILVYGANKPPYLKHILNEQQLYGLVYYPYQQMEIIKNVYLVYSKEANHKPNYLFTNNRAVRGKKIFGTFVVIASENKQAVSLTDEQIEEVKKLIK